MGTLSNVHPGKILLKNFLNQCHISAYILSKDIGIPQTRTSAIIKRYRGTADKSNAILKVFRALKAKVNLNVELLGGEFRGIL